MKGRAKEDKVLKRLWETERQWSVVSSAAVSGLSGFSHSPAVCVALDALPAPPLGTLFV